MNKLLILIPFLFCACAPFKFHATGKISGGMGIDGMYKSKEDNIKKEESAKMPVKK